MSRYFEVQFSASQNGFNNKLLLYTDYSFYFYFFLTRLAESVVRQLEIIIMLSERISYYYTHVSNITMDVCCVVSLRVPNYTRT